MGDYVNKSSIEYRVSTGELPQPEEVKKFYIEENHSYKETMSHFNMSKSTLNSYVNKYNLNKEHIKFGDKQNTQEPSKKEEKTEVVTVPEITSETQPERSSKLMPDMTVGINTPEPVESAENAQNQAQVKDNNVDYNSKDLSTVVNFVKTLSPEYDYLEKAFRTCFEYNLFYDEKVLKNFNAEKDENGLKKYPTDESLINRYVYYITTNEFYINNRFIDQLQRQNFNEIYKTSLIENVLTEDDKKNRQQAVTIYGYDPFAEDKAEDLPQLYRDLTDLVNDSMRKDAAKKKAAIEIVRNYLNIKRYQNRVTEYMMKDYLDTDEQKALDQCLSMIAKIQDSINKTAKENSFSGGKTIGSNGKGMLSDVMEQIEGQGYDKGITNFYDIATSKAIEEISKISMQSMLNQVNFSKIDYADIITQQCKMVHEAQQIARDAQEALRIAKEKIVKQELIMELEKEYRKKGINEQEIAEFITREYDLVEEL